MPTSRRSRQPQQLPYEHSAFSGSDTDVSSIPDLDPPGRLDSEQLAGLDSDGTNDEFRSCDGISEEAILESESSRHSSYVPQHSSPHRTGNKARPRAKLELPDTTVVRSDRYDHSPADTYAHEDTKGNDAAQGSEDTQRKVRDLEAEIARLKSEHRARTPPNAVPTYRWTTFHLLDGHDAYLDEPQWVMGDGEPVLKATNAIRSYDHYINMHPELAFVFYNDYETVRPRNMNDIQTSDGVFRRAKPLKQTVRLIDERMIETARLFFDKVPEFHSMFPDFDTARELPAPYLPLYYSLDYVEEICADFDRTDALLMYLLEDAILESYGREYTNAKIKAGEGITTRQLLPYLIQPGDIIVAPKGPKTQAFLALSWPMATSSSSFKDVEEEVEETWSASSRPQVRGERSNAQKFVHSFKLRAWTFGFDGNFSRRYHDIAINLTCVYDDDEVAITDLNCFPIRYLPPSHKKVLACRGEMFWRCRYKRLVTYHEKNRSTLTNIADRYMVDTVTCLKIGPKSIREKELLSRTEERTEYIQSSFILKEHPPRTKEIYLFPPILYGYNLRSKTWSALFVDHMADVNWNKQAFENLVIDPSTKQLVRALVTNQLEAEEVTDEISGKGGGLIMLLHGAPGTGKTFTAEGVAEFAEKPLLRVTCGDVGIDAREVENYLSRCFKLGKLWDCVVLLDEADVFLEERDFKDLNRNALVSVFLRVLEYYQGILILTSNRVGTFDEAFKSRIQLALHYEDLTAPQRRKIWRNFMEKLRRTDDSSIDFDDIIDHLDEIAQKEMNGREIRNAITTGRQLAKYEKARFNYQHLEQAIEVGARFGEYLKGLRGGETHSKVMRDEGIR